MRMPISSRIIYTVSEYPQSSRPVASRGFIVSVSSRPPYTLTNTSFNSHREVMEVFPLGIAPQEYICFTMLALIALASWLALRPGARLVS
ncbi:MAG: hypothetical protein ABSC76_21100 [Terracidiphilus sp.]|jgi:hypothetical protein